MPPGCFSVLRVLLDHNGKLNNQSSIAENERVVHLEASLESIFIFLIKILILNDVLLFFLMIFKRILSVPCVDHRCIRLFFLFFVYIPLWILNSVFLVDQFSDDDVFVVDHDIVEQLEEASQLSDFFRFAYLITCYLNHVRYNMDELE